MGDKTLVSPGRGADEEGRPHISGRYRKSLTPNHGGGRTVEARDGRSYGCLAVLALDIAAIVRGDTTPYLRQCWLCQEPKRRASSAWR